MIGVKHIMNVYELIKSQAQQCRKYGDKVLVFLDNTNHEFYLQSFSGLKRTDTVVDALSDEGGKIAEYITRYNHNGVELRIVKGA